MDQNALMMFGTASNESAYGTSRIAMDKNNLFGYGASDSDPYIGLIHIIVHAIQLWIMRRRQVVVIHLQLANIIMVVIMEIRLVDEM